MTGAGQPPRLQVRRAGPSNHLAPLGRRGPDLPRLLRRPAHPGHRRARPRPRAGLGRRARPLVAAGVPAPPRDRHRRRGARRTPAGVGHLGAADPDRRHRPAGVRRAGRGDPRVRHGVRRGGERRAAARRTAPELERLGIEPAPWEPWTPLAVFHAQHLLFASVPGKLWHHRARAVLGADEALLSRDPAYSSGSNAWAVGGARTASGKPLIGGDPHRAFESPGVYAQVRLATTTSSTSSASPSRASRACSTSRTPARWPGRSPTPSPTTRTSTRSPWTTWSTAARRPSPCAAPTR